MLDSFFPASELTMTAESKAAQNQANVCLITLTFIDHISDGDFPNAVQLLKHDSFRVAGASVPVWNSKLRKAEMRPVSGLAGLLCYTNPIA